MITEVIVAVLLMVGSLFMLVAAIGVVRLPDVFMRMHAATKAGTVGISNLVIALAIFFGEVDIGMQALLVVVFFFLTAPIAAHMIGRAAYFIGVPLYDGTRTDEISEVHARKRRPQGEAATGPRPPEGAEPPEAGTDPERLD